MWDLGIPRGKREETVGEPGHFAGENCLEESVLYSMTQSVVLVESPISVPEKMKENQTSILKKLLKKYKPEIREITDS